MDAHIDFTVMTIPLPFVGDDTVIQRNAVLSWTLLKPRPEILLLGSEFGVAEFAEEHGLVHIPNVSMTKFGLPSVKSVLELGQTGASNELIAYVDADTILMSDFPLVMLAVSMVFNSFMMCGYRKEDYMTHLIPFEDSNWEIDLKEHMQAYGALYNPKLGSGSDYFAFRRGLFQSSDIPDFSIGKGHWDGWRMKYALDHSAELLDCSDIIFQIHQKHPWRNWFVGPATHENLTLAGGEINMRWVHHSTRKLTQEWLDETLARLSIAGE